MTTNHISEKMNISRLGQLCCRELNLATSSRFSSLSMSGFTSSAITGTKSTFSNSRDPVPKLSVYHPVGHTTLKRKSSSGSSPPMPKTKHPPRTFSGIQPTGVLHLGNYLGAVKGWVKGLEVSDWKDGQLEFLRKKNNSALVMPLWRWGVRRGVQEYFA